MSGFEYAGVGLMIATIPMALIARWLRIVTWHGAGAIAIAIYMLAIGIVFVSDGAWTCVEWQDSIREWTSPEGPRIPYSTRTCAEYGTDRVFVGLGAGMLATAVVISAGFVLARSATHRRIAFAAATVMSVSSLGYAYAPSGLIAGAFSIVYLGLTAVRNWDIRPAGPLVDSDRV